MSQISIDDKKRRRYRKGNEDEGEGQGEIGRYQNNNKISFLGENTYCDGSPLAVASTEKTFPKSGKKHRDLQTPLLLSRPPPGPPSNLRYVAPPPSLVFVTFAMHDELGRIDR